MHPVLPGESSNKFIIALIERGEPFSIIRLGLGSETQSTYDHLTMKLHPRTHSLASNAGIYWSNDEELIRYYTMYDEAIHSSDAMAVVNHPPMFKEQLYFIKRHKLLGIHGRSIEPFYYAYEKITPWTHSLFGKRVLIINPFVESFKRQMENGFTIFKKDHMQVFKEGQEFVYYKSFQTAAGNHLHSSWLETFNIMCDDISKLDFDVALLGCGGYGLPLCNFIKKKLGKSAIYVGGSIQLLFGVMGKRWESIKFWQDIIKDNDTQFIRPSKDEALSNSDVIESSCYW